jgi:hypothetical protein
MLKNNSVKSYKISIVLNSDYHDQKIFHAPSIFLRYMWVIKTKIAKVKTRKSVSNFFVYDEHLHLTYFYVIGYVYIDYVVKFPKMYILSMMVSIQKVLHVLLTINEFVDDRQMDKIHKEIMLYFDYNENRNDEELKVK